MKMSLLCLRKEFDSVDDMFMLSLCRTLTLINKETTTIRITLSLRHEIAKQSGIERNL